jgi:hypothetical protein
MDNTLGGKDALTREHALAERVLSLEEPWRGRFLSVIAGFSSIAAWASLPSSTELASRLTDQSIYRKVDGLLRLWVRSD